MVSLKMDSSAECYPSSYDCCPVIYLTEDQCEALGIDPKLQAGAVVTVQARAVVTSITQRAEDDGDDKGPDISVSLKLTDMEPLTTAKTAAARLYGKD